MPVGAKTSHMPSVAENWPICLIFHWFELLPMEARTGQHALEPSASRFGASKGLCEFGSSDRAQE
jgi:hypothetical protein